MELHLHTAVTLPQRRRSATGAAGELPGPSGLVDGRYRVERELGRGGMGVVLLAEDVHLRRRVAIKLAIPDGGSHPDSVERMRAEAAALASVRSAHVAQVHAFGLHDGAPFIAMEYVEGLDLRALLHQHYDVHHDPVPVHRGVSILRQVADGLAAVHRAGLVHRDVKPANVVIERGTGRAVLVDFSVATVRGAEGEGDRQRLAGTPFYMPPEYYHDDAPVPSPQGDIYSLGCLACELLTGEPPFLRATPIAVCAAHLMSPAPRLSQRRPELRPLDDVVVRMLAKKPEARFRSCAALANVLARMTLPEAPDSPSSEDGLAAGPRILVVDDDPLFGRLAARCAQIAFAGTPVSVARAGSAAAALQSAQRRRPDQVILDYQLPDMDGVDLLSHLREVRHGGHTRVVVASAGVAQDARWRFGILGVEDFVDKPVELSALVALITSVGREHGWIDAEGTAR